MRAMRVRSTPSWLQLAGLALLVAMAHGLILQSARLRLGTAPVPDPLVTKAFNTRTVEPKASPQPETAPAQPPVVKKPKPRIAPKPVARPPPAPEIASNTPVAPVEPAQPATDSIASAAPPEPSASANTSLASPTSTVSAASIPAAIATAPVTPATTALPAQPAPTVVTAVKLPESVRLEYKMTGTSKGLEYHANAELDWKNAGGDYEAGMRVSALFLGSRTMNSRGRITAAGLAPTRFSDKSRSELAAHFEADKGKITFSANTPDMPWLQGAQDRVSVFLQLGGMLAASGNAVPGATAFPPGSSITVYTVGPREADSWTFVVEGEESLSLPAGDMPALKLTRKARREFDQKVEIWYAPALNYLPVRNRITQANGDFVDQQLKAIVKP